MIGVNTDNVVKIYHSSDFSQVKPTYRVKEQERMVESIIETIEKNTDMNTMPRQNPSFKNFLFSKKKDANLEDALQALHDYAAKYNRSQIP